MQNVVLFEIIFLRALSLLLFVFESSISIEHVGFACNAMNETKKKTSTYCCTYSSCT